MAEGVTQQRSFTGSISKESGDADERFCEPCTNRGKYIAVEGYCQICEEYLCDNCIEVHKSQKMTRGHTILDKHVMPKEENVSFTSQHLCVEVCKTHHPEIVKYYCKAHDEPGCGDCMVLNHTSCKKDMVQDISDGFQATEEFKLIHQNLDKFHKALEKMKDTLEKDMQNLDTIYNNIQHAITYYRKCINEYLDQVQKQVTEEAAQMKKGRETEMKIMIAKNESVKSELEDTIGRLQNDSDVNVNSIFVITKQAQRRLDTIEREINRMKTTQQNQQQQHLNAFRPSIEIVNLVSAKIPLGKLTRKPTINTTASYRGDIKVKTETDRSKPFIWDCTLLSQNRMVVLDQDNRRIKLLNLHDNVVLSSYGTSTKPWGIAAVGTDQVAVTLPTVGKIQVFNVIPNFTEDRQIHVNNNCRGIAYRDERFAVGYVHPGKVEILDIQGNVLHKIQPKQGTKDMLKEPYFLTFGLDDDTVIVSDRQANNVSVVTFGGQILRTYTHDTLKAPQGLVSTADGVLFVCSQVRNSIHVVSPDFKTSQIIIDDANSMVNHHSITYCDTNHRLYISNCLALSENIHVYDLNV